MMVRDPADLSGIYICNHELLIQDILPRVIAFYGYGNPARRPEGCG